MPEAKTVPIDDYLRGKVLARLGRTDGVVSIQAEEWDFGYCETCSWPEEGFSVQVNGVQVWPSEEYLDAFGGYIYADDQGEVQGDNLSIWGHFFDWLDGKDLKALAEEEDEPDA